MEWLLINIQKRLRNLICVPVFLDQVIESCDLLILDELGYVPFQKQGAELLFHIIADCYEQKSVIVTSNLEFGQWNRVFGDNQLTSVLHLREKVIVYAIRCLLETLKFPFKKSSC